MNIEVVFVLQIVRTKLSEAMSQGQESAKSSDAHISSREGPLLSFVPGHDVGYSDLVESSEEGEGGKDDGSNEELPLVENLEGRQLLHSPLVSTYVLHISTRLR